MRFPSEITRYLPIWLIWMMVMVCHLATEIVVSEDNPQIWLVITKVLLVVGISGYLLRHSLKQKSLPVNLTVILAMLGMVGPFLIDPIWQVLFGYGHAFELKLVIGLRNLALVAVIWSHLPRFEKMAGIISLFTLLFCVSSSQDRSLFAVSGIYLLLGISWLSCNYWYSLKTAPSSRTNYTPWFLYSVIGVLLTAALILFSLPQETRTRITRGFLPSSGGSGEYDPYAKSGVGDGDSLVAGTTEANAFAPIENAPFIEGSEPSLYDMFQDTYGEAKIPKKFERAISLPPEAVKMNHHRMAQSKKSSKTFSMRRQKNQSSSHRHLKDTESDAVFHLVGRVPAHLRMEVFDLFDGTEWYPEETRESHLKALRIETVDEKPWITWNYSKGFDVFDGIEAHALKVLNINTNRVPSLVNHIGIHIDRLDQTHMVKWAQEDVLAMDRKKLPALSVIHTQSRLIDREKAKNRRLYLYNQIQEYTLVPQGFHYDRIEEIAKEWTKDCKSDWEKIVAIENQLKQNYQLNNQTVVPDNCVNPISWFLLKEKQGPDFLFATSAAMLLRSVGIPTRAISGFYADPDHYDPVARQTSVYAQDIHWWTEVYLGTGVWSTVDPSPGYQVLSPNRSLLAQSWILLKRVSQLSLAYWPVSLMFIGLIILFFMNIRKITARVLQWIWCMKHRRKNQNDDYRQLVLDMVNVLDKKLILARNPRPCSQTLMTYLNESPSHNYHLKLTNEDLIVLGQCSNWAIYSPLNDEPPKSLPEISSVRQTCLRVLDATRITDIKNQMKEQTKDLSI